MAKEEKYAVRNAADPSQVKRAGENEKLVREQELSDLNAVLSTAEGKRLMWRLLSECGTFESIWEPSAKIHYLAGKQDVGHFLMGEIVEASPSALLDMMESKQVN